MSMVLNTLAGVFRLQLNGNLTDFDGKILDESRGLRCCAGMGMISTILVMAISVEMKRRKIFPGVPRHGEHGGDQR